MIKRQELFSTGENTQTLQKQLRVRSAFLQSVAHLPNPNPIPQIHLNSVYPISGEVRTAVLIVEFDIDISREIT